MGSDRDEAVFVEIAERLGGRLVRHSPLTGGVAARVEAVELAQADGEVRQVVFRQPGAATWKGSPADSARLEFELLGWLRARGVAVPRPLLLGQGLRPFFVMEHIEGVREVADLPGALSRIAEVLAALHGLDLAGVPALPEREDPVAGLLALLPADHALRSLLQADPPTLSPRRTLLHGDFWPGNLLWRGRELVAVIDWEDAALGDPLSDVACCALELRYQHGADAAETFVAHYARSSGLDLAELPLWTAYVSAAALASMHQWGLDPALESRMRREAEAALRGAASTYLKQKSS